MLTRHGRPDHLVGGPAYAAALWTANICGLMPFLGIQSGPSTWNAREFAFIGVAHFTYGTVMALVLDAFVNRGH